MERVKEIRSEKLQSVTTKTVKQAFLELLEDEGRTESAYIELLVKKDLKARGLLK